MTYKYMVGDQTTAVYRAVDPDGTRLGNWRRAVEYTEHDDHVKVVVAGDNRHVAVRQYDGGCAEAILTQHHTWPRQQEFLHDIDVHEVLTAVRAAIGPQRPTPPPRKPGDHS